MSVAHETLCVQYIVSETNRHPNYRLLLKPLFIEEIKTIGVGTRSLPPLSHFYVKQTKRSSNTTSQFNFRLLLIKKWFIIELNVQKKRKQTSKKKLELKVNHPPQSLDSITISGTILTFFVHV